MDQSWFESKSGRLQNSLGESFHHVDFVFDREFFLKILDIRKNFTHWLIKFTVHLHTASNGKIFIELFFSGSFRPFFLGAFYAENIFVRLGFILPYGHAV